MYVPPNLRIWIFNLIIPKNFEISRNFFFALRVNYFGEKHSCLKIKFRGVSWLRRSPGVHFGVCPLKFFFEVWTCKNFPKVKKIFFGRTIVLVYFCIMKWKKIFSLWKIFWTLIFSVGIYKTGEFFVRYTVLWGIVVKLMVCRKKFSYKIFRSDRRWGRYGAEKHDDVEVGWCNNLWKIVMNLWFMV